VLIGAADAKPNETNILLQFSINRFISSPEKSGFAHEAPTTLKKEREWC
jgi:hypothetical protein